MKETILSGLVKMGGKGTTPEIRDHMGIVKANNFSANMTELFNLGLVKKTKDPHSRNGTQNIWIVTKQGGAYLTKHKNLVRPYPEIVQELQKRYDAMRARKELSPGKQKIHPKVSKGVGQAMDSLAILIEENQKRDVLLRSIRTMIDLSLQDFDDEKDEELE